MSSERKGRGGAPEIEISASASATRLRFRKVPRIVSERIALPDGGGDTGSEREHLPSEARANETYRGVRVRAWVKSRLRRVD